MQDALDAALAALQGLPPFLADTVRYANGLVLLALLLVPLERAFALRPAPRRGPREHGARVAWYFLTSLLPGRLLALPLFALAWIAALCVPEGLRTGVAAWPAPLRFAAALVVAELGAYLGHRAMHAHPRLWRFHAVHHATEHLDWLANARAHPVDLVFTRFCSLAPLVLLGLAQPASPRADWIPLAVVLAASSWGYVIHANVRWRWRWLAPFVVTPAFHHAHHAREPSSAGHRHGNYAALLPVMDRVFGTLRLDASPWPEAYGIDEPMPADVAGQLVEPFHAPPSTATAPAPGAAA